jgi:RNA polymerase sigma factor (sigma-70 family)
VDVLSISPAIWLQSAILAARVHGEEITSAAEELVVRLFQQEGRSLVRLARLFVDDRDAAEDLVQEAFLRLARSAHRIADIDRAPAYLRSIVLNLARDHNRRGLVSLRHHSTSIRPTSIGQREDAASSPAPSTPDLLVQSEDHRMVIEAVRSLPVRQRDCITLRYFEELGIDAIATTLGLSPNSVKTHLQRGLAGLERSLSGSR